MHCLTTSLHQPRTSTIAYSSRKTNMDKAARDNRSNQLNPNNPRYQGGSTGYAGKGDKADLDNHAQQLNPNNPKYNAPKK